MSDLQQILREEYERTMLDIMDPTSLLKMIEEIMEIQTPLTEEATAPAGIEFAPQEMLLKMIPDIEVSEIGWSDVRTPDEGTEIKGPQRQLLENYLRNIQGDGFEERIKSVAQFYSTGSDMIDEQAGADRTQRIVQAISYLVFYKTLTKVITNFNASSAGFSFESFLAARVDGYQIPANTGTIADYIDRSTGADIPVSLKLYTKGGLEVGGSYTDLVNDLVNPQYGGIKGAMRYVVCTKQLSGDGLEQEGQINFYQFDFTLDNVMEILAASRLSEVIRLPQVVASSLSAGQQAGATALLNLPDKEKALSAEELTPLFTRALAQEIGTAAEANPDNPITQIDEDALKKLIDALNWEKNDDIFNNSQDKVRGAESLGKRQVLNWVKSSYKELPELHIPLRDAIVNANAVVIASQKASAKKSERNKQIEDLIAQGEFLSVEDSARQYGLLGRAQKKQALLASLGYLRTYHFALNERQATNPGPPTNTIDLGSIMVGRRMVAQVLDSVRELLNEEVYEIFQSLKILSDSLNAFFAGGLKNDALAVAAVDNAENIQSKEILQPDE